MTTCSKWILGLTALGLACSGSSGPSRSRELGLDARQADQALRDAPRDAARDQRVATTADLGRDAAIDAAKRADAAARDAGADAGVGTAPDCLALHLAHPELGDGRYTIDPSGKAPVNVFCDMTTAGGGWTVYFDVCGEAEASRQQPLNAALGALAVGRIRATTVAGDEQDITWLEPGIAKVADLYADPWLEPTRGIEWRTRRLGDGLDLLDDGDCASRAGTITCKHLFNAFNRADPAFGNDYGCDDRTSCLSLQGTSALYLRAVCRLAVRSSDLTSLPAAASCKAHRAVGRAIDGVYRIDPDGAGSRAEFDVYCDMTTAGGGWTLITSLAANQAVTEVDDATPITPQSVNVTNRNMRLPDVTEVLTVNDGRDEGYETAYDQANRFSGVSGISLTWQQLIDGLNTNSGAIWGDIEYSTGVAEAWRFTVARVNSSGCLQGALRGAYGEGNYGGFNGGGYAPKGALYLHWGQEQWLAGVYGVVGDTYYLNDLRCDASVRLFTRFWHGVYLR